MASRLPRQWIVKHAVRFMHHQVEQTSCPGRKGYNLRLLLASFSGPGAAKRERRDSGITRLKPPCTVNVLKLLSRQLAPNCKYTTNSLVDPS